MRAAGLSIRELERIRDENLVGILQSLKAGRDGEGWGAGKLLAEFEERLRASAPPPTAPLLSRQSRSCTRVRRKLDRMERAEKTGAAPNDTRQRVRITRRCARLLVKSDAQTISGPPRHRRDPQ